MNYFPDFAEPFGRLDITDVIAIHDRPRLFLLSASNLGTGDRVLVMWADELPDRDVWYYVAIPENEIKSLLETKISLFSAVSNKPVYKVDTPFIGEEGFSITLLEPAQVERDVFPDDDFFVKSSCIFDINGKEKYPSQENVEK